MLKISGLIEILETKQILVIAMLHPIIYWQLEKYSRFTS